MPSWGDSFSWNAAFQNEKCNVVNRRRIETRYWWLNFLITNRQIGPFFCNGKSCTESQLGKRKKFMDVARMGLFSLKIFHYPRQQTWIFKIISYRISLNWTIPTSWLKIRILIESNCKMVLNAILWLSIIFLWILRYNTHIVDVEEVAFSNQTGTRLLQLDSRRWSFGSETFKHTHREFSL